MTKSGLSLSSSHTVFLTVASIDIDYPIECDDEYWENEDPALAFKQPPGKPSTVAFFNYTLRLNKIHAYALRTIVCLSYCPPCLALTQSNSTRSSAHTS